jgi:hypothetical protein
LIWVVRENQIIQIKMKNGSQLLLGMAVCRREKIESLALYIFCYKMDNSMYSKLVESNPVKYPANIGKVWLDDEIVRLLKSVKDKKTHNEIATEHGRTLGGIVSRLKSIAADYYFDDLMSIDDIQQMTGLNKKKISNAIANRELQNYKKVVKAVSIKVAKAGSVTGAAVNGKIENINAKIDTVVSVSPLYVSLLAERLQVDTPIRLPFQSIATNVVANSGNNRITLNSSCVDAIVVCPLAADPNAFLANASQTVLNSTRYKFNSGRTTADANTGLFQLQVGSEVFPRQPLRIDECADLTVNSIYGNSAKSTNTLFAGLAGAAVSTYSRAAYLAENCVIMQKFMLGEEGWASGLLAGINCSGVSTDFVVSTSNLSAYLFIAALMTSQLVFNPATSSVSIEQ